MPDTRRESKTRKQHSDNKIADFEKYPEKYLDN
jgi:hypothetical protein